MRFIFLLFICGIAFGVYHSQKKEISHPPGILVAQDPFQQAITRPSWQLKEYTISPVAVYSLKARVLSASTYWLDRNSELAPVDVAIGWKRMSDTALLNKLNISQSSRWYYLSWHEDIDISPPEIFAESANMHLIPANDKIKKQIKSLKAGDIIELRGYLVNVNADDGFYWNSSQTRGDTGDGSCELMWVENIKILP